MGNSIIINIIRVIRQTYFSSLLFYFEQPIPHHLVMECQKQKGEYQQEEEKEKEKKRKKTKTKKREKKNQINWNSIGNSCKVQSESEREDLEVERNTRVGQELMVDM